MLCLHVCVLWELKTQQQVYPTLPFDSVALCSLAGLKLWRLGWFESLCFPGVGTKGVKNHTQLLSTVSFVGLT